MCPVLMRFSLAPVMPNVEVEVWVLRRARTVDTSVLRVHEGTGVRFLRKPKTKPGAPKNQNHHTKDQNYI